MEQTVIAKVVLIRSGELQIFLPNYKTVYATPASLIALFSDPYGFIEGGFRKHTESTRYINPKKKNMENLAGLTIVNIYEDTSIHIIFPVVLRVIFDAMEIANNGQINLTHYVSQKNFMDQKEFLLKFYLDCAALSDYDVTVSRKVPFNAESFSPIIEDFFKKQVENIYTLTDSTGQINTNKPEQQEQTEMLSSLSENSLPDKGNEGTVNTQYIPLIEFAKLHNVSSTTAYIWYKRNKLYDTIVGIDGKVYVNKDEGYPVNLKTGRKENFKANGQKRVTLKGNSYEDLQRYLKERNLFTENVRPYIRSKLEADYYEKHIYREVVWNGRHCLIIDINPFYFSKKYQKTNRELIEEGNSPVVPGHDDVFILHHIGQTNESPFAIVPESDHRENYQIFHQGNAGDPIRRPEFEVEKKMFWKTYLEEFDRAGMDYKRIPAINSKYLRESSRKGTYYDKSIQT